MQVERVGEWSIQKLDILKAYMGAYAGIMSVENRKWLSAFYYVEAFAGPGLVSMREGDVLDPEAEAYLQGSPLRALECEPRFDHLWFIDKRSSRKANLIGLLNSRGETDRADVKVGDCNELLEGIVAGINRRTERALVFLDPYGLQLDWRTVESLAKSERVDVFINFSVMGIIRNLPREGRPANDVRETLGRVMKSVAWMDEIYSDQFRLFDDALSSKRRPIDARRLAATYASDLEGVFGHVSDPVVMTNSKGGPLYALILASHKSLAKDRMNQIINRKSRTSRKDEGLSARVH